MKLFASLVAAALLCGHAPTARADSDLDDVKRFGDRVVLGAKADVRGLMYAAGAGWQSTKLLSVTGAVGYAWGTQRIGLLNPVSVHHVSLEPVVVSGAGNLDPDVAAAVMLGHTWRAFLHVSVAAGVNLRITPDIGIGPLAKLRVGYGQYGLYFYGGTVSGSGSGSGTEGVAGLGIELFHIPSLPLLTRVKNAVKAHVE